MIWIVLFHYSNHNNIDMSMEAFSVNWIILAFFRLGGGIANAVFVLISGFLLSQKQFKTRRVVKLWLEVLFYSVLTGTVAVFIGKAQLSAKYIVNVAFPIVRNQYWFITSYMVLVFLSPIINSLYVSSNKKQIEHAIIVMMVVFSVLPTFLRVSWMNDLNCIPIFILLYMVGAYIAKWGIPRLSKKTIFVLTFGCVLLIWLSEIVCKLMGIAAFGYFVWPMNKMPILLAGLGIFACVHDIKLNLPRMINQISSSILAVYLIHLSPLSKWIFIDLLRAETMYYSPLMIIHALLSSIGIILVSILADKVRMYVLEKPIERLISCVADKSRKTNEVSEV